MLSPPQSLNDVDKWQSETEKREKLSNHVLVPKTSICCRRKNTWKKYSVITTSGRELPRDSKALDPWGTAARRSDNTVELKTSAR